MTTEFTPEEQKQFDLDTAADLARIRNRERRDQGLPYTSNSGRHISSVEVDMLEECGR